MNNKYPSNSEAGRLNVIETQIDYRLPAVVCYVNESAQHNIPDRIVSQPVRFWFEIFFCHILLSQFHENLRAVIEGLKQIVTRTLFAGILGLRNSGLFLATPKR